MTEGKEVKFSEIKLGTSFESLRTKRCFQGVRIEETQVVRIDKQSRKVQIIDMNAIITKNYAGEIAHDAGALIWFKEDDLVIPL